MGVFFLADVLNCKQNKVWIAVSGLSVKLFSHIKIRTNEKTHENLE